MIDVEAFRTFIVEIEVGSVWVLSVCNPGQLIFEEGLHGNAKAGQAFRGSSTAARNLDSEILLYRYVRTEGGREAVLKVWCSGSRLAEHVTLKVLNQAEGVNLPVGATSFYLVRAPSFSWKAHSGKRSD